MSTHSIMLLRPTGELTKTVEESVKKLEGIKEIKIKTEIARTAPEMAKLIDQGRRFEAIIAEHPIEEIDINYILSLYRPLKRKPPLLLSKENYERLANRLRGTEVTPAIKGFSREFIYDYLGETLLFSEKKIDNRIIKEVLTAATSIIFSNTQLTMEVAALNEISFKGSQQEMSSVIAFTGDGLLGTLSFATTNRLISLFCQKMLFCEASDVTPSMCTDVLNELSNQILGSTRLKLAQSGYELGSSLQLVVSGEQPHHYLAKSSGHYYRVKLKHGEDDFHITFAYGTYPKQKGEANFDRSKLANMSLDVRIVNSLVKAAGEVLLIGSDRPQKRGLAEQKGEDYQADSLHLLHGRGHRGSFILALELPFPTIKAYIKETLKLETEGLTPAMINQVGGELVHSLAASFKKTSAGYGYDFINVFNGGFCASKSLTYLLKNQGLYCRLEFKVRNLPFTICFGMEAAASPKIFDLWSYIKSLGQLAKGKAASAS